MLKKSAGKHCRFLNVKMVDKYGYDMYNICIDTIRIEWDENKNIINQEKHGVSSGLYLHVRLHQTRRKAMKGAEDHEKT